MGWWHVGADTLAASRFVISPLAEATASFITLARGTAAHQGERAWLDAHLPGYHKRLAADPVTAELVRAGLGPRWIADVFTAPPGGAPGGEEAFAEEVARIREMPLDAALADLASELGGVVPPRLRGHDLPGTAAALLDWVWTRTVLPYWPQRRRVLEADIVARTAGLADGGWATAIAGMRPGMRWLGQGRLQINAYDYPPREISGARLFFVPVTLDTGWVAWYEPRRYAVMYPCSGVLAQPGGRPAADPLGALLGPGRAAILILLDSPKSTTQLVVLTGQALGSVGRHLKILLQAGLVTRRRAGRSMLYYRTAAGDTVVSASGSARHLSMVCLMTASPEC